MPFVKIKSRELLIILAKEKWNDGLMVMLHWHQE